MKSIFIGVLALYANLVFGQDIGDRYIASKQTVTVSFILAEKVKMKVREIIEFTPNCYFEPSAVSNESHTFAIRTSLVEWVGDSKSAAALIQEPQVALSAGNYLGITRSRLDGFRFLVDVDLGKEPPKNFQLTVEYTSTCNTDLSRLALSVAPYIHNLEFIPPIFFKMGLYEIDVVVPDGITVEAAHNGTMVKKGTESIKVRLEDADALVFQLSTAAKK